MYKTKLIVGPSKLWVYDHKHLFCFHQKLTWKLDFFKQISLNFFINNNKFISNKNALDIIAASVLLKKNNYLFDSANDYIRLIREIYEYGLTPKEILCKISKTSYLIQLFTILEDIHKIFINSLLTEDSLSLCMVINFLQKIQYSVIEFKDIFIYTNMELNIIEKLSKLGTNIIFNFAKQLYSSKAKYFFNILYIRFKAFTNISVNFYDNKCSDIVKKLFLNAPLSKKELNKTHLSISTNEEEEVLWIVETIIALINSAAKTQKIAIVIGDNDFFAIKLKKFLKKYGLKYRNFNIKFLIDSPIFGLLINFLKIDRNNLNLISVLHIIENPLFKFNLKNKLSFCKAFLIIKTFRFDFNYSSLSIKEYKNLILRLKLLLIKVNNRNKKNIKLLLIIIQKIIRLVKMFPRFALLQDFVNISLIFLKNYTVNLYMEEKKLLISTIKSFKDVFLHIKLDCKMQGVISNIQYFRWLKKKLSKVFLYMSSTKFIGDIELLDFNDVIGRNFDILSISNLSFSTFYNFSKSSVLLDNKSKLLLNKLLDESIFIVNDVDNHKKYLSIEHLKFLAACNSCSGNLLISCSLFDVNNKEKHISESLIIIINSLFSVNILVKQKIIISNLKLIISSLNKKLLNISYSSTYYFINEYTFNILKKFIIKNKINSYQFFHRNNFQLQSDYLMRKYPIKLGLLSKHPITPTFVESVAKCKFKAFVEKFLFKNKIETLNLNLLIGKLAHTILMIFFNNRINKNIFSSRFNSTDKEYLFSILDKYSNKFLLKFKYFNKLKVKLRIQRLRDSLLRMFYKQSKNNKMLNFFPKKCEYSIGINYIRYKIKPVPVSFGKYMVYFGGIIDRIDESDDKILLIDYKLSSISSLRFNLSKNNIFKRHFQIPLYSFLLKNTWESVTKNVNSCLLSINDGIMSQIVNFDEIYKNDNSAKSIYDNILISSLINTLEPFFHGVIRPTNSDICYNCKLSIACRVSCVQ